MICTSNLCTCLFFIDAPMDSDLLPTSKYFEILHQHRADLDFLMPQFYNGVTRPAVDGVDGTGAGALSAASMFDSLSNELFDSEPNKVSLLSTWTHDVHFYLSQLINRSSFLYRLYLVIAFQTVVVPARIQMQLRRYK